MATAPEQLHEDDFYAWTRLQTRALRRLAETRPNEEVDWPRVVEEVFGLGTDQRDAVRSMVMTVMEHFLKLENSPAAYPRAGWAETIVRSRRALEAKLTKALRRDLERRWERLYAAARSDADIGLRLYRELDAAASLPETCPYTLALVLDPAWFPPSRHGLPDVL